MPVRFLISMILSVLFCTSPKESHAQTPLLEEAIRLYHDDQPVDAVERLRTLLTSAEVASFTEETIATAYTYLAMSEWMLHRRSEAEAAMESALRADGRTFAEFGRDWAKDNRELTDPVVMKFLDKGIMLWDDAEYDRAVMEFTMVLPIEDAIGNLAAAEIHKFLAFCYVALRKTTQARLEFRTALRLNKDLELGDNSVIAPKLRRPFLAVRRDALRQSQSSSRRNTLLRSLLLPGWGQLYRGDRLKGYGFMAAEMMMLTGFFLSARSYGQARDAYLNFGVDDAVVIFDQQNSVADVTNELEARFVRYRSQGTRTNLVIGLAAGVWIANLIDALILTMHRDGLRVASETDTRNSGLSMRWNPDVRRWDMTYGINW